MPSASDLTTALVAVRALHTGASLLLFGALVFGAFVDRSGAEGAPRRPPARRAFALGWLAVAVTGIAWLAVEAVEMSGGPWDRAADAATLRAVLVSTVFGQAWLVRGALLLLLGAAALVRSRAHGATTTLLPATCAGALVASLAWAGHANAQSGLDGVLHHVADAAHLLAAGAWLGGLVPFAVALHRAPVAAADTARRVRRYGDLAAVCVGVLVASGAANAVYTLGSPALLLQSGYGRLLLLKLGLFGAMLAIAAFNRWRLTPDLVALPGVAEVAMRRLRRLAWLEWLIGLAVIGLASALATSAPPMRM